MRSFISAHSSASLAGLRNIKSGENRLKKDHEGRQLRLARQEFWDAGVKWDRKSYLSGGSGTEGYRTAFTYQDP